GPQKGNVQDLRRKVCGPTTFGKPLQTFSFDRADHGGVGRGKIYVALIQHNFAFVRSCGKRHKIDLGSDAEIATHPEVIERFQKEVDLANEDFAKWEKIKQFRLTPDVWNVEEGHLTPTLKLKRKIVKEKYLALYKDIYGHGAP